MAIYDDIRAALEVHLNSASGIPTDIAWENVNFEPTTGTSYLKPRLLFTSRRPAVRGLNPQHLYEGVFQIIVYCPEGEGPKVASDFADTLINHFDSTLDITYNGITVSIDYAERQQGIESGNWYYIPVDIAWYIYAQ